MQVINMHLVSQSVWPDEKEVFYLAVSGDSFVHAQCVDLKFIKGLDTVPFYVFEHPPTEDGFLGVDEANSTFVFATKHPTISHCYKYFVTDLKTLKQKGQYNPWADTEAFVSHFKAADSSSYSWRKPFTLFEKGEWFPHTLFAPPPPPKPKYKWTLTSQGVAFQ
jgi:hypothetical protein